MQATQEPGTCSLRELLARHPLFEDFPSEYLDTLADCAKDAQFRAGDTIFREGEEANYFYLICDGLVVLEAFSLEQGHLPIQSLDDGDVFGWSWLVPPYRWRFDAIAERHTHTIEIDGAKLRARCENDPAFGYELLKRLVVLMEQRLQATRVRLFEKVGSRR